jgi:hypothetical protein
VTPEKCTSLIDPFGFEAHGFAFQEQRRTKHCGWKGVEDGVRDKGACMYVGLWPMCGKGHYRGSLLCACTNLDIHAKAPVDRSFDLNVVKMVARDVPWPTMFSAKYGVLSGSE